MDVIWIRVYDLIRDPSQPDKFVWSDELTWSGQKGVLTGDGRVLKAYDVSNLTLGKQYWMCYSVPNSIKSECEVYVVTQIESTMGTDDPFSTVFERVA